MREATLSSFPVRTVFANYDKACGVPEEDAYVMSDETRAAVEENVFGIYDGTKYNNDY